MFCPKCKNHDTRVIDSRDTNDNKEIRRRRICESCDFRFTTFERIEPNSILVVKKDESRQLYDREKLERGIWKACEKRSVIPEKIEEMITKLEEQWSSLGKEIKSTKIGEDIMKQLLKIDEVAYIRFASVYRQFKDVETFRKELQKLL